MKKLLITEDIKTAIGEEEDILSRDDIRVYTSSSGNEILDIHRSEGLDFILMDLETQGKRGDEVCSIIKSGDGFKRVPVMIVCNDDIADIERAYTCKANAYMIAPLDHEAVLRNIQKFLHVSSRRSVRALFHRVVKIVRYNMPLFANSENLSSSGMRFASRSGLEVGETLRCQFFIGSDHVDLNCNVVRMSKGERGIYFFGIEFDELDNRAYSIIVNYIHTFFQHNYYLSIGLTTR